MPYDLDNDLFYQNVVADGGNMLLSDQPWFIKFYAPWCPHCQALEPTWNELGEFYEGLNTVNIARVDCTSESGEVICKKFDVHSFPTLYYFPSGEVDDLDA